MATAEQKAAAALLIVTAVGECIRDLNAVSGPVISGHLYARLMSRLSLEQYTVIINRLKQVGLVTESNHQLTWVGPAKA